MDSCLWDIQIRSGLCLVSLELFDLFCWDQQNQNDQTLCHVHSELSKVRKIEADCCKFMPFPSLGDWSHNSSNRELPLGYFIHPSHQVIQVHYSCSLFVFLVSKHKLNNMAEKVCPCLIVVDKCYFQSRVLPLLFIWSAFYLFDNYCQIQIIFPLSLMRVLPSILFDFFLPRWPESCIWS